MPKFYKSPFYTESQIEEMDEKDIKFPYSSEYMRYDSLKRQYIPTEELFLKYGVDIGAFVESMGGNATIGLNNELEYISDQIYTYINKNSGSNIETLKCIVAKGIRRGISPYRFRIMFQEILWKQARFYIHNDDPTKQTGIDVEQKQYLGKGIFINEDRHIDPKVKTMLMDLGLVWAGSYDNQFAGLVLREDW